MIEYIWFLGKEIGLATMADGPRHTRLIICVDGTWCDPDGPHGRRDKNVTNVYRFYASVRRGECVDASGKRYVF